MNIRDMNMNSRPFNIIVARDVNHGIGKDGSIPWHCPEDLKHFKQVTKGHTVVMGRKTAESIVDRLGGPLPDRYSIVISKSGWKHPGFATFDCIYRVVASVSSSFSTGYVIGGAQAYDLFMPYTNEIYLTDIGVECDCDTFFEVPENFKAWSVSQVVGLHGIPRVITTFRADTAENRGFWL